MLDSKLAVQSHNPYSICSNFFDLNKGPQLGNGEFRNRASFLAMQPVVMHYLLYPFHVRIINSS